MFSFISDIWRQAARVLRDVIHVSYLGVSATLMTWVVTTPDGQVANSAVHRPVGQMDYG